MDQPTEDTYSHLYILATIIRRSHSQIKAVVKNHRPIYMSNKPIDLEKVLPIGIPGACEDESDQLVPKMTMKGCLLYIEAFSTLSMSNELGTTKLH